jgi:cytochrome c556
MPYTKVIQQLKENLQTAYRQAIDADVKLDELQKAGHGKFSTIFSTDQGFKAQSARFLPYVQELADELETLQDKIHIEQQALEEHVIKLGVLLQTLQAFKENSK